MLYKSNFLYVFLEVSNFGKVFGLLALNPSCMDFILSAAAACSFSGLGLHADIEMSMIIKNKFFILKILLVGYWYKSNFL